MFGTRHVVIGTFNEQEVRTKNNRKARFKSRVNFLSSKYVVIYQDNLITGSVLLP